MSKNNQLEFIDYCNLMETIERSGEKPTYNVTSHNKDTLSYWDAYQNVKLINNQFDELKDTITSGRQYNAIVMGDLISLLRYKGIVTEEDFNEMLEHTKKTYEDSQKGKG